MKRKAVSGIMLTLLLTSMLTLAFNIQTIKTDHSITLVDNREIIATYDKAYLENVSGLPVLHVKGSPYEMGCQYGILLKNYIQDAVKDPIISDAYYINCSQIMEPHIPQEYIEEMHGLADEANVSYTDILVLNTYYDAMYHCSGFAVFGDSTIDGHLYHGYNDDWWLPPENQSWGVVTVYEPDNGNAFVNVGFFAEVVVWSGINEEGISLSESLSRSNDTTLEGMPVGFINRKTLQYSNNLSQAINIINQTDRTTGHNILLGDGKNLNACVVEVSDNYVKVFWAGDPAEDVYPHFSITNAVRRTNHYVDPELAATQRSPYDPRDSWNWSWNRYEKLSQLILDNYSNISAETSIEFLKTPPVAGWCPTLQSMVFDSTDLELWVANANSTTSAYLREYIHLSYADLFPLATYTLTVNSATGGTTDPLAGSYTYEENEVATVTATPNMNYYFDHWQYNGHTSASNPIIITMTQNYTLTPVFVYTGGSGVPEFPIGLAMEILFIPVVIYIFWRNRQRKKPFP